jgi:FkbM family methyltransferase
MPMLQEMPFLRRTLWRAARKAYCAARSDLPDDDISRNGEARLQRDVLKLLGARNERAVIFDVGANIGAWTLSFLHGRQTLAPRLDFELHAFEPVPDTYRTLLASLEGNAERARVVPVPKALSSRTGTAHIYAAGTNSGTNSLHEDALRPGRAALTVELTTADAYAAERGIREIHLMKCDAEGHDCEVILGARGLLEAGRIRVLQFEYNHVWISSRHYLKDVFDVVAGRGYSVGKITPERLEILPAWHPELERFFSANFALIRDDMVSELAHLRLATDGSNTFA